MLALEGKTILVTGGQGFLGRHLVSLLKSSKITGSKIIVSDHLKCDLIKWNDCKSIVKGVDIVIHLAARVGGIGFNQKFPGTLFYENLLMGTHLMEAARQEKVEKFVGVGTICSYPKFTPVPFKEGNLWDGYPEETNAPYGLAKKMLLVQSQAYRQQYGFNSINLLPVNLYGPGDNFDPQSSHVIPALIKKVAEAKQKSQKYIEVWGTGKATREFLYVGDAARATVLATKYYEKSEPVNVGSGFEISIRELVKTICRLLNYRGKIHWDNSRPDGQPRRCLDTSKAKKEFRFSAKVKFDQGLKETIDWYQNYLATLSHP